MPRRHQQVRHTLGHLGGALDPHAAYLLDRGLKTLALRVERQCVNALALATALQAHHAVRASEAARERCPRL
jgi:cystathionine beta-lyase/cystathionine gamma-synthase